MKSWCKIIEVGDYDILVQRLCNNAEGEHIKITLRVPEGQMIKTLSFDEEDDDAEEKAIEAYNLYDEKRAEEFVKAFEEMYNAHDETENQNDKKEG
jgi:hypothetical protein